MTAPYSLNIPCSICMAPRGSHCQSRGGRVLKVAHMDRSSEPVRAYVAERMSWRWSA